MGDQHPLRRWTRRPGRLAKGVTAAAAVSLTVFGFAPLPAAHAGTTITVTTTADETTTDGNCSLEEAIQAANTDTAVDACPAGSGADTIALASGATYTLTTVDNNGEGPNGVPIITSAITINGNGATITRSRASGTPLFRLTDILSGGGSLTLDNLAVTNFDEPAGVGINGVQGLGGAILSHGDLAVNGSTIAGNRAEFSQLTDADGGAIWDGGTLTVTNSTISNNTAVGRGGSVGGGIIIRPGSTTTITSSTFAGNSGNNGADLETEASALTITDTIMASGCLLEGPVTDGGHNLDVGSSCGFNGATDLRNTNPQLGSLANNGGPTPTQALPAGSPAVDAGGSCPGAGGVNQRGSPRFSPCDIGAFEIQDQAIVPIGAQTLSGTEGGSVNGTLAVFTDGDTPTHGDFSATVNWGDGSASTTAPVGQVSGQQAQFFVSGSHPYAEEGTFDGTVLITDGDSSGTAVIIHFTSNIQDAALTASGGATLTGTEGPTSLLGPSDTAPVTGTVATFTDANPGRTLSDFTATIAWGDGTTSAGTVSGPSGGTFSVAGSHSYTENGTYTITVTIADVGGATATGTTTAAIADPPFPLSLLDIVEDLLGG